MSDAISQQLKGEFVAICARVSSHGFTAGFDFVEGLPAEIITTFSKDWLEEYQSNGYSMHDPVVLWGTAHTGVKNWNELSRMYPKEQIDVIKIARQRGMSNGTVISFDLNRMRAVIGITHESASLSDDDLKSIRGKMAEILFSMPETRRVTVSEKGTALLTALSQGMSETEFADGTGVTLRAVNALRSRTLEKLGTSTVAQAVLKAYRSRIID